MGTWLIIRNVASEGPDLLARVLEEEGIAYRVVDAFAAARVPERPEGIEAVVVLGGPMAVYETAAHPILERERRLLRTSADAGVPVLGICLGAQLLANAFGARVYPGPMKEIGWAPISLTPAGTADPVIGPLAGDPPVFHLHGDTFDRPQGAVHLARSRDYPMQAFRIGTRAYGLQFHLEFTAPSIAAIVGDPACRTDLTTLGRSAGDIVAESSERAHTLEPLARQVFRNFARLA
jgi:GMP synthase-like glutamine amidotransferase